MKKLGFWTLIVVFAAVAGGALSYKPWRAFLEQRSIAVGQKAEMDQAERNRAKLAREKAQLESNAGREALARSHGFSKPGEQPVESK
jgi:cell division protein FtsB